MSLFENKEETPKSKMVNSGKAKIANIVKDASGAIITLVLDVNGNGQRVKYNEKIHGKEPKIHDEILI